MLVLSRKVREKIYIGDDICITVTHIDQGKVSIGIEAPPHVRIDREEVRRLLTDERKQAPRERA